MYLYYMSVCVFSSHSFWTSSSSDVPAGVTQEEGHTGFLILLLSAVRAFIFLARRIQPFLSLVDREVEFLCTTNDLIVLHPLGIFFFIFLFFSEKNPVCRDGTHVPTCQRLHGTPELPGRSIYIHVFIFYIFSLYIALCMYVCMVITYTGSRVWINRVRLPILLVVS